MANHGHLCAVARHADHLLDLDDAVVNLGHFKLKQTLDKNRRRTADDHLRAGACLVGGYHVFHHRADHVAFAIAVLVNLALFLDDQFYLVVDHEHLAAASLVDLADHNLVHQLGVVAVNVLLLNVANPLAEGLEGRLDSTAAKIVDLDCFSHFIVHLVILINLQRGALLNLHDGIFQVVVLHYRADVDDLVVAVVGVEDDLERLRVVGAVALLDQRAEHVLDDDLKRVTVDVFLARNLCERGYEHGALHGRFGLGTSVFVLRAWRLEIGLRNCAWPVKRLKCGGTLGGRRITTS